MNIYDTRSVDETKKKEEKRKQFEVMRNELEIERSSFLQHWRDLADYILPRRARFTITDSNKGDKRNQKILDSSATLSARTLKAGLMAGITSPARPWFKLRVTDQALNDIPSVKIWLDEVTKRMNSVFIKSNLYNILPTVYGDIGVFGTAAVLIEEDYNDVIRFYPFPIGSYYIANDEKLKVNTFMREFRMTVSQLVNKFGKPVDGLNIIDWSVFSLHVKNLYDSGHMQAWIDICHVIHPNNEYDAQNPTSKKYLSCYYEKGTSVSGGYSPDSYLRMSGYDYFPVLAPRWEVTGEDVYGTDCPAMTALGDIKQLQTSEKRILQAIDKIVNPPMKAPVALKNSKASILSGDVTYVDERDGQRGFTPVHEVRANLIELENKQQQVRQRISRAFYEDLFLMLAQSDRKQITAREIEERHEEKLLALGAVLEQLNQDFLDPLIDITFLIMDRQELIPMPPEELQGVDLRVEYISIMAQAQKLIGLAGIDRFMTFASQLVAVNPEALDKIDMDKALDVYGDITGIEAGIVRPTDDASDIRAGRAEQQQAAKALEVAQQGSQAAKNLSETEVQGENALDRMIANAEYGAMA